MKTARDFSFAIDLPIAIEWSSIDIVRTAIQNCLSAVFHDIDGCRTIAMVAGELLENAVKYGDWTGPEAGFRLRVWGVGTQAHVMVENRVLANDTRVAGLLETLAWMKGFTSPEEAFRAKLVQVAETPDTRAGESGLGLVRVAYEGNCVIAAEVKDATLRVTADIPLEGASAHG